MAMYLAIDIGGTKTLLAVFSLSGELIESQKFLTPKDYGKFKYELKKSIEESFGKHEFKIACCAVPGRLNYKSGIAEGFGNLDWQNILIRADVSDILGIPVLVENDAKLAGLSEAQLVLRQYKKVQYLTVSTGIGGGLIIDGKLEPNFELSEPGHMMLEHNGKLTKWEDFASGRAIVKRYGKKASEIDDPKTWHSITKDLAAGMIDVIAMVQPDVVIIGGGVGTHFEKFGKMLNDELKKYENPLVPIPPIVGAKRPETAVIYGCYELIKQNKTS